MLLSLLKTGFINALQTHQACQSGGMAPFQAQSAIDRKMSLFFLRVIPIVPANHKAPKNRAHIQLVRTFVVLARLGLITGVDLFGCLFQQVLHESVAGFEEGGTQEHFQFLDRNTIGLLGRETGDYLLDFGVLGEENFGRGDFFLKPAMSARVTPTISSTYCSMSWWKF